MKNVSILQVEDNPNDEALTLRALKKNNIMMIFYMNKEPAAFLGAFLGSKRVLAK